MTTRAKKVKAADLHAGDWIRHEGATCEIVRIRNTKEGRLIALAGPKARAEGPILILAPGDALNVICRWPATP
jgi:hypothetical protein